MGAQASVLLWTCCISLAGVVLVQVLRGFTVHSNQAVST